MNEPARLKRLRAFLAARDRSRADDLLCKAQPQSDGLADELSRPGIEREPFLVSKAFARTLDAHDDTDEAIARAAALIELLRWILNHRSLMEASDPREAISSSELPDTDKSRAINLLAAACELLESRDAALLIAPMEALRDPPSRETWARGHDAELIGKRGTAKKNIGRWQALLVREIAALVPDATVNRDAAIAELLSVAGIETIRQYVRETLRHRRP